MPRTASTKTSSKTPARSYKKSAAKSAAKDVLALLAEDHKKVIAMFDQFEQMKKEQDEDDEARQMLVEMACAELTMHAQVEEEIFYPAMRASIDDMDLLDEAEVEHASAKQLITELSSMKPGDEQYDAKFTVLGEYVKHHIEEEEKELFKKAKKSGCDLKALGEEVEERKHELRAEMGLSETEEEEEQMIKPTASKSKRKSVH